MYTKFLDERNIYSISSVLWSINRTIKLQTADCRRSETETDNWDCWRTLKNYRCKKKILDSCKAVIFSLKESFFNLNTHALPFLTLISLYLTMITIFYIHIYLTPIYNLSQTFKLKFLFNSSKFSYTCINIYTQKFENFSRFEKSKLEKTLGLFILCQT